MAATSSSSPIPLLYRLVFTYIDPAFCLLGFWTHIFDAATTTESYSPTNTNVGTGTQHILTNLSAFFAYLFVVEGILLRVRGNDVAVWRIVQAAGVLLDGVMTVGALRMLADERRLMDVGAWRADDWRYVVGNAGMGAVRLACALGVGMGGKERRE